jgi:hypothetical protein
VCEELKIFHKKVTDLLEDKERQLSLIRMGEL